MFAALGAAAGLCAGLFGIGGGIIIVPALHFLFLAQGFSPPAVMHLAVTTSLFTILFTGMASAWGHHRRGAMRWSVAGNLMPGILLGGLAGAWLAVQISSDGLRYIFAVFELLVAVHLMVGGTPASRIALPARGGMLLAGGGIGGCSVLLGIGGGTLTVPLLLWCRFPVRSAIAIAAACGVPIALVGSSALIFLGLDIEGLPRHSIGYLYWPAALPLILASLCTAPLGVWCAHRLPVVCLRRALAAVLAVIGIRMLM